jgi:hypothetical protein
MEFRPLVGVGIFKSFGVYHPMLSGLENKRRETPFTLLAIGSMSRTKPLSVSMVTSLQSRLLFRLVQAFWSRTISIWCRQRLDDDRLHRVDREAGLISERTDPQVRANSGESCARFRLR